MGAYHPQVVHFAVGLAFAGVGFRLLSLTGHLRFTSPAATTLVLLGTLACFAATQTGTAAHAPVERIPGVRPAVVEHEELGERARNLMVVVSLFELAALVLTRWQKPQAFAVTVAAAVAGLGGLVAIYEASEHGGQLVYNYAGGVGIRSGNPEDITQLFVTGAYQQALLDRQNGRRDEAMALVELAAARVPTNLELQLMAAEWTTDVKRDPAFALSRLDGLQIAQENTRLRVRAGLARASALMAQGNADGAKAVLHTLQSEFPANAQIKRRLEELSAPRP